MDLQTDDLIQECGASAMGFLDAMFHRTTATFTIVDRNAAPGAPGTIAIRGFACINPTTFTDWLPVRWVMTASTATGPMPA